MIDPFVLLAPVLLLVVVALLRFVGCNWVFGIEETVLAPEFASVQHNSDGDGTAGASRPVTFVEADVTVGNAIIVAAVWNSSTATASISDNQGNTYITDLGPVTHSSFARRCQIWSALNVKGGPTTVTVTFSESVTNSVAIHEYSGLATSAAKDQPAFADSGTTPSTSLDSGPTPTTTQAKELLFGFGCGGVDLNVSAAGTNYTLRQSRTNPAPGLGTEDLVVSATGTYRAIFTIDVSTNWICAIVTYK